MLVDEPKEYYTIQEYADLLRVDRRTISRAIKEGRIQALKIGNNSKSVYRIHKDELSRMAYWDMMTTINRVVEEKINERMKNG